MTDPNPDILQHVLGTAHPAQRLTEVLAAYEDILREIGKLRDLDLTDIHPAVVFDPEPGAPRR